MRVVRRGLIIMTGHGLESEIRNLRDYGIKVRLVDWGGPIGVITLDRMR